MYIAAQKWYKNKTKTKKSDFFVFPWLMKGFVVIIITNNFINIALFKIDITKCVTRATE